MLIHHPIDKFWMPNTAPFYKAAGGVLVPGYIQGNTGQNGATASTTIPVTLTSAVGSGHMLCVTVNWAGLVGESLVSVTDDKSNTYALVDSIVNANFCSANAYILNVTNAPQTITATISNSRAFGSIVVDEWSNVLASSALDGHVSQTQTNAGTGANAITSGSITTTANGDLIYGYTVSVSGLGATAGTGFTQRQGLSSTFYTENLIQATAGSTAATFTASSATDIFNTFVMAFKHA